MFSVLKKAAKKVLPSGMLYSIRRTKYRFRNRNLIMNNKKFRNIHSGKRCFILGNGPSLREVDLSLLADEFVFSVNNFPQVKNFHQARTNFHLWMDLSFFDMRDDMKYNMDAVMQNYHAMSEENAICFVPTAAREFIRRNNIDKFLDINYMLIYDDLLRGDRIAYDLTSSVTGFSTVVQYAAEVALYMGFKEIYLLGCDSTNILSVINNALNIPNENVHAYDKDDVNMHDRMILNSHMMSDIFMNYYRVFFGFKRLNDLCVQEGIKFFNCSSTTIVNEVPRMNLEDVLKAGKEIL